ncbi:MAG: glutamate formimidoyltransferase [Gemmatimonadales bacterium]|nr:glutamate formimidoyltransferase [Gemmatimonadales bacterium]
MSEGRDPLRMARFAAAVEEVRGVELLHKSADPDHHRMVLAYRGGPPVVAKATTALAAAVYAEVDLRRHRGRHPRIGALDVVPFVRGPGCSEADALGASRSFGAWAAARSVPVFFYERAATNPDRTSLPAIRSGQFEGLAEKLSHPQWRPDLGPSAPHRSLGAVVVGVRGPLVRFNVNLDTEDPGPARRIAAAIRESGGGLRHVRALGIPLRRRALTQVSMNLTRYAVTGVDAVYERVAEGARAEGVRLAGSEFIGPVPAEAIRGLDPARLDADLAPDQILELPGTRDGGEGGEA